MEEGILETYEFKDLPSKTSFRIAELLPGGEDSPISCRIHIGDWDNPPKYEAVSYAWGNASLRAPIICDGKILEVTQSLRVALTHLRLRDRSRFLWADVVW